MERKAQPDWRLLATCSAIALAIAACSNEASAPPLSEPEPVEAVETVIETVSFTESGLAAADARFAQIIADNDRSGIVAVFARHGEIAHVSEHGWSNVEAQTPMTADTVVRIASMTKPVTAAAILMLIEDGVLSLDTPVSTYIPAFADARVATSTDINADMEIPTEALTREITIEDLLTHTSGMGYVFDYETRLGALYLGNNVYEAEDLSVSQRMDVLAGLPLYTQPGEAFYYSWSNDILGYVVAQASDMSLEAFFQTRIFEPLGMRSTSFYTERLESQDISTGYTHDETGALVAIEGSSEQPALMAWETGGAGLFSTANDYFKFAQMLANGGTYEGRQILSPESVTALSTAHVGADRMPDEYDAANLGFGYSVAVSYEGNGQSWRRPGDYGWSGFFDTGFVISPSTGVVGLVMAQEVPGPTTGETVGARAVFDELLYSALPRES